MEKMKRVAALILSLVMVLSLAACSSTDDKTTEAANTGTTKASSTDTADSSNSSADASGAVQTGNNNINACIASEPETIDPALIQSTDGFTYTHHMFEGLMKYTSTDETAGDDQELYGTEVGYGQAESYEISENDQGQTVYTFKLRDNIYWSDGEPVVAGDFEYSWKRALDPDTNSDNAYLLKGVVVNATEIQDGDVNPSELGIVALDDKTLEITLVADCSYFLQLCANATFMPLRQDVIEEYGTSWTNPGNMVSNGAFILSDWVHDSYIKMTPNDYYYNSDSITPDSITWWLSDSQTAMISAYESGNYDFLLKGVPVDRIADLQESGDLFITPFIGAYYLYINADVVTDWRVRAALTLAIDSEYLVENITQAGEIAATGFVPTGITNSEGDEWSETYSSVLYEAVGKLYPEYDLSDYSGRCELAQTLYQEAVEDGAWDESKTISYNFNTSDTHEQIAESIQSDWQSVLGFNCTLSNQDWNVYSTGLENGDFGVGRMGWIAAYDDATIYLEMFSEGNSYNYSNWSNDEYTALIEKAKTMEAGAERDEVMHDAEVLLFGEDGFPLIPIYFYTINYCRTSNLKNIEYTAYGYFFFHHATIDE